ncbi:hypothetical protein MMC30_009354 [Trapelia coarctata]|nr:hypothetical protein [Trapelia coarctata]
MSQESYPELEQFREQWRAEVTARSKAATSTSENPVRKPRSPWLPGPAPEHKLHPAIRPPFTSRSIPDVEAEDYGPEDLESKPDRDLQADIAGPSKPSSSSRSTQEPQSALEHYEKALDAKVDQTYKTKHFPPSSFPLKPTDPNPSNAAVTVPNPAHHSLHGPPRTVSQLIQSFALITITGAPPPTEASPTPPCPISSIPPEVLNEILLRTATTDVAAYMRLALVCRRLAYLALTEESIWKRVCSGPEFGFAAMHYNFAVSIDGTPLPSPVSLAQVSAPTLAPSPPSFPSPTIPLTLTLTSTHPTYLHMFHRRPRLRFSGVYISTVNYVRPGASSPTTISWNTPVHIVTYYRYLRFFRDGSCISLLTTAEPVDVVHHLLKENLHTNHGALPSNVMKNALRGRWRLSGHVAPPTLLSDSTTTPNPNPTISFSHPTKTGTEPHPQPSEEQERELEGTLHIETLGPDSKYTYHLNLALRSASNRPGSTKNNKLVWRGFWSYNRLTDDWAEFGLRNDRAFFWSRVRSWGTA